MSGLFGIVSRENCMEELFYGTDYQSHLGTEFGGLAIQGEHLNRAIHRISNGQFKNLFYDFYHNKSGTQGIGVISDSDPQPIILKSSFGVFTIVCAGLIRNAQELADQLLAGGTTFSEVIDGRINQTELVAKLIATGDDVVSGMQKVFDGVQGSISLLVMTSDGLYAGTDPAGRLPLIVGRGQADGRMAVTTETCAFPNLGLEEDRPLKPGEIVFFNQNEMRSLKPGCGHCKICSFLWIYTGYPASSYAGISVESVRERCGCALARKDDTEADLASGVPDSGTGHAVGYAMESKLPFRRPLVKYAAGYGRSYIPPSQEVRDRIAKLKLIPIRDVIAGQRLIVCEDSIVRGTQLKNLTIHKLWDAGAAQIHIRVACPPLMFPCRYSQSTQSSKELVARRAIRDLEGGEPSADVLKEYLDSSTARYAKMVDWITKDLNCTSLIFLSLQEVVEAIGLPQDDLCTFCWNGCD